MLYLITSNRGFGNSLWPDYLWLPVKEQQESIPPLTYGLFESASRDERTQSEFSEHSLGAEPRFYTVSMGAAFMIFASPPAGRFAATYLCAG